MHQVPALFLHRLGEGVQARGLDRLRRRGELWVHCGAVSHSFPSVIKDMELNLGGDAFERLEDIRVLHVGDGNVKRMFRALDKLDEMRNDFSIDLGALRIEVKIEALGAEGRDACHGSVSFSSQQCGAHSAEMFQALLMSRARRQLHCRTTERVEIALRVCNEGRVTCLTLCERQTVHLIWPSLRIMIVTITKPLTKFRSKRQRRRPNQTLENYRV